jgi:hypothetical protein
MKAWARNVAGVALGFAIGWLATAPLVAQSQDGSALAPFLITQTGGWNHTVQCDATGVALTISIDGAAAVPAAGLTWSGTAAPYTATMPFSQMPAAARTIGPHTIAVTAPATTITLADGSSYTYPAGTVTSYYKVLPDTPAANPPRTPRWIKILGTVLVGVVVGLVAWLA